MSYDRSHATADHDTHGPTAGATAAGRASASEHLLGGRAPMPSGLLRKADGDDHGEVAPDADAHVGRAEAGSGAPLPAALRSQFEGSLGHDLGDVRVHTGADSAAAAESVNARAFALGNNIHFGAGQYDPASTDGQRLLAHEVVHTVQQQGSAPRAQFKLAVSSPGDAHEVEADTLADQMIARQPAAAPTALGGGAIARKPVTGAARGIYRWRASDRNGFRRFADVPWIKENPKDSWNHGPNNYITVGTATPAPGDDRPNDIQAPYAGKFPEPLDGLKTDGTSYGLPPYTTVQKANTAIDALAAVIDATTTTHNAMAARVRDYATAADQVATDQFYGVAPNGLNWAKPKDGGPADAGQLAEKQVPKDGKVAMGDVFGPKGEVSGVGAKTMAAGKQDAISKLLEDARGKDNGVKTAVNAYHEYTRFTIGGAFRNVAKAYNALSLNKLNGEKEDAGDKKTQLETEKKEALEVVSTCGKVVEKGAKVLEGDTPAARELILLAAEKVVSSVYDKEIKEQENIIKGLRFSIRAIEQQQVLLAVKDAEEALALATAGLAAKRQAVVEALKARQDAYDTAAAEAKKAAIAHGADPKEAERLQSAIAAIPRIEIVVNKLKHIVSTAVMPGYSDDAGLAYAVGRNGNRGIDAPAFERAIGAISHYGQRYGAEQTKWEARLASSRAIAEGLNVPAANAK
jgi:hypothetical protein